MMRLTKSELEIMEVLWAADEPLCRADIIARSQDKTWKDSSVHILLNSMLKKEAIQEAGFLDGLFLQHAVQQDVDRAVFPGFVLGAGNDVRTAQGLISGPQYLHDL